jgi:hypothetical protein
MKRTAIVLVVALASAGALFAQGAGPGLGRGPMMGRGYNQGQALQQEAPKTSTIEGKLLLVDKYPALQAKDKTYMLRWPSFFFYAYTDGIKEGAQVKVEGYELPAFPGQDKPFFAVVKVTIGAKVYDLSQDDGFGPGGCPMMGGPGGGGRGMMGGRGGRGGRW